MTLMATGERLFQRLRQRGRELKHQLRRLLAPAQPASSPDRRQGDRRRDPRILSQDRRVPVLPRPPIAQGNDPSPHVTVLIHCDGVHMGSGCLWDLGPTGIGVMLIQPLALPWGSMVELVLLTGRDADELRVQAELRWLEQTDHQALAGFRFAAEALPADSSLARLLAEHSPSNPSQNQERSSCG
jgi:hypothetical protein